MRAIGRLFRLASPVNVALIGDVTFAHDAGSLALAAETTNPLAIVVIDNRGGRIFEHLPIAGVVDDATFARFTTPPAFDITAVAAAFGIPTAVCEDAASTRAALVEATSSPRAHVIVVRVPPHSARDALASIREDLA